MSNWDNKRITRWCRKCKQRVSIKEFTNNHGFEFQSHCDQCIRGPKS